MPVNAACGLDASGPTVLITPVYRVLLGSSCRDIRRKGGYLLLTMLGLVQSSKQDPDVRTGDLVSVSGSATDLLVISPLFFSLLSFAVCVN